MSSSESGDAPPIQNVVIIGGGPAGAAAAYWLSAPEQKGRYRITLYTQGWRLGGKCASGRNAAIGNRIEEHGLHMLMGCYQNAFATMRSCYLDWRAVKKDPANPFQTWKDAFLPQRLVSLIEQDGPGTPATWSPWNFPFPTLPGEPGDGPLVPGLGAGSIERDLDKLVLQMFEWLVAHLPKDLPFIKGFLRAHAEVHSAVHQTPELPTAAIAALRISAEEIHVALAGEASIVGRILTAGEHQLLHRLTILADVGVAIAIGYFSDIYGRGPGAYDELNSKDFRAWLASHGASQATLGSAPIRAFYDLTFAVTAGIPDVPVAGSIAAGVSLRAQMEMVLGYRNAPLWKMAAGMGDTVFTPFYDVLTARGVEIAFFSRAIGIRTNAGSIEEIDIAVQAKTIDGSAYRPFTRVRNLDCWPNQPDWSQLVDGQALQKAGVNFESSYCTVTAGPPRVLKAGSDFDLAIVAIPPAALAPIANDLAAASGLWQSALDKSASVATQSMQLWMQPDLAGLGWQYGTTVLTAYTEPYDSWGDMSQVIQRETWSGPATPGSIGYFCGCMDMATGPVSPPEMNEAATLAANRWLVNDIRALWPDIGADPLKDPLVLSRFDVANFDISDRYVQTPAGQNVASRFSPESPAGYSNLYVVGDWTKTRFSGGCFESAIESGMLASRAISGFPQAIKTS